MARVLTFHRSELEWGYSDEEVGFEELIGGHRRRFPEFSPLSLLPRDEDHEAEMEFLGRDVSPELRQTVRVLGRSPAPVIEFLPKGLFPHEVGEEGSEPIPIAVGSPGTYFEEFVVYVPLWEQRNRRRTGR